MDLPATLALITLFLTLGAFGYSRLRKPAAGSNYYRAGGRAGNGTDRRKVRTDGVALTHPEVGP